MRVSRHGKVFGFRNENQVNVGRVHIVKYPPNTYFKDFLIKMKPKERRIWLKCFGDRVSFSIRNNPEYIEKLKGRMIGNTYVQDYLIKNPKYAVPDWGECIPHITVPCFVPVINERISNRETTQYYTLGVLPSGMSMTGFHVQRG